MRNVMHRLAIPHSPVLFALLFVVVALSVTLAITMDALYLLALPAILVFGMLLAANYKAVYFLLWATIPISTEVYLGGFGTDLPDEPLMLLCAGMAVVLLLFRGTKLRFKQLYHPITLLLGYHLAWLVIASMTSLTPLISWKFTIAKMWYVAAFYVLTLMLIDPVKDLPKLVKWVLVPTSLTILYVMARHATLGFSFSTINEVLNPFYRNHVSYALMLGALTPFAWFFRDSWKGKYTGIALTALFVIGLYFAYTRAAYIGLIVAFGSILVLRLKLIKPVIVLGIIIAVVGVLKMAEQNRYLDFAPNYERTITHTEFDDLIEATYQLEDISTMERVYRWVAGFYMYADRPLMGFGPGAFYSYYHSYADENFATYVSDNPEHSGIHNYYLMTLVEQGTIGLIIFVLLCAFALMKAQWLYHRLEKGPARNALLAASATLVFIFTTCMLNDMIETDKVGSIFFLCLAILVALERHLKTALPPVSEAGME